MYRFCNIIHKGLTTKATTLSSTLEPRQIAIYQTLWLQKPGVPTNVAANTQKKASKPSPKITLVAQNQAISVTSLEEAQKLAKRRDLHLKLLQEFDSKTQRPMYKLVTAAEILSDELTELNPAEKSASADNSKTAHKKTEKSLTIGSRISEHDLASRLKNIGRWLVKQHEVRILIQGGSDDMSKSEKIVKAIEQSIQEPELVGKIVQKRTKNTIVKFNILPVATTSKSGAGPA